LVSWSGSCSGTQSCAVTVSGPSTITATFERVAAPTQTSALFPAVETAGTVPVEVQCASATSGRQTVSFGMPFPRGFVSDAALVRLETTAGTEIPIDVSVLAPWRHLRDAALDNTSVRSVLISFSHDCAAGGAGTYRVRWGTARTLSANSGITPSNVTSNWVAKAAPAAGEHPATDNYEVDATVPPVREPAAWVALPSQWLMRANIRGPVAPIRDAEMLDFVTGFGKTYVNDVATDVTNFESDDGRGYVNWATEVEGWLYDRPFALWNVYVQTGNAKWLRHAHRASQFYASLIAPDDTRVPYKRGGFTRKAPTWATDPGDAKYSLSGGLFAAYLLTGDARLLDKLRAIGEFQAKHVITRLFPYDRTSGLWTERHLGAALAGQLYAFEATGDAVFRSKALEIVAGMRQDVESPPPGYPSASEMRGVLFHRSEVHEGGETPDLYMSPWMAALLGETLWHYYMISDDPVALRFLSDYAQLIAERGIYNEASDPHLGTYWAPWYGLGLRNGYTDDGIYGDVEHAMDVLGLLARGRWARERLGQPVDQINVQMGRLSTTARYTLQGWKRDSATLPRYRLSPTRKFGWWFGSTFDQSWFGLF
jgi:hypothetical protein